MMKLYVAMIILLPPFLSPGRSSIAIFQSTEHLQDDSQNMIKAERIHKINTTKAMNYLELTWIAR